MDQDQDELRHGIERTRREMGQTIDAIEDRVRPGRMAQRQRNRMAGSLHSMRERVMGVAHDAEGSMSGAATSMREAPHTVERATQGSPLMAGAIAFGAGFIAAAAFPPSDAERRAAGKAMDTLEPTKQQLAGAAKQSAEHLKESAMQAGDQVKDEAQAAAADMRDQTRDAVGETTEEIRRDVEERRAG